MNDHLNEKVLADYDRLHNDVGQLAYSDWGLVALRGEDRLEWLQGQATNDVMPLVAGSVVSFCLCTPTGQIEAVVDAWPDGDHILMTTVRECVPALMRRIDQMVIMEDVEGEDLSDSFRHICMAGPRAVGVEFDARYKVATHRAGPSVDAWVTEPPDVSLVGREAVNIVRLEYGVASWGSDITAKTLPPELGPAFEARHVSYTKGCYTGQEILQRIHSRGHTNKTWVGLVADSEMDLGAQVDHVDRPNVGTITSSAFSPKLGWIAVATLRNEATEARTRVVVQTQRGDVEAETRALPFL